MDNVRKFQLLKAAERHNTVAETRYWCKQYKIFAGELLAEVQAAQSAAVPVVPDYSVTQLQRLKSLMSNLGLSTDESLEGFCLDADRQLSRAITAMEKTLKALMSVPVVGEPWRWIVNKANGEPLLSLLTCDEAKRYLTDGFVVFPVYRQPTTSIPAAELDALRKDAALRAAQSKLDAASRTETHPNAKEYLITEAREIIDAAIAGEKK